MRRREQITRRLSGEPEVLPEPLFTISVKVPVSTAEAWREVAADCDLPISTACAIGLTKFAKILEANWRRGLSLSGFSEGVRFDGDQLDLFLEREARRK